jgi:acyl-CoA thioesterase-1
MELSMNRRYFNVSALGLLLFGSFTALAKTQATLLVVGDSLSAEYGLKRGTGWVALLDKRLRDEGKSITVVNASISGDTTSGGLSRLPPLLTQHKPQMVLIELGGNDALRGLPLKTSQDNLESMVKAAQNQGAKVLLLGMQVPPNYGPQYAAEFSAMYAEVAKRHKVGLVPFFLKGVADADNADSLFQSDRIHPVEAAHPIMLGNVWPALRKLLP